MSVWTRPKRPKPHDLYGSSSEDSSVDKRWLQESDQFGPDVDLQEYFRFEDFVFCDTKIQLDPDLSIASTLFERKKNKQAHWTNRITETSQTREHACDVIVRQDSEGDCILFISIICERRALTLALVDLLCSPKHLQVTNRLFQNALHLATIVGDHVMVRRLLVGGIEVDRKDRHGNTALHIACERSNIKIAKTILTPISYQETRVNRYKAPFRRIPQNMEIRNNEGLTCLHVAAMKKDIQMIELLLSKNADVNARYMKDGKTVMHHFCEIGDRTLVEFLLKRSDLNCNIRTYGGTTAAAVARYRGHYPLVSLLHYAGAKHVSPCEDTEDEASDSDSD